MWARGRHGRRISRGERGCAAELQRIVVGEIQYEECLDLLIALNSGIPGMCTLHANSAREALVKMCTLPLLAGENVSAVLASPSFAVSALPAGTDALTASAMVCYPASS